LEAARLPRGIDDEVARLKARHDDVWKTLAHRQKLIRSRGDMQTDRTRQGAVDEHRDEPRVRTFVIGIGEQPGPVRLNKAFSRISFVAHAEYRFFILRTIGAPIFHTFEKACHALGESGRFMLLKQWEPPQSLNSYVAIVCILTNLAPEAFRHF